MRLNVTSETGKLKSVLVHLPGREIDIMVPSMMEELLFDDILFGQHAREEHRRFQQIIWFVADEVHDLQDLLEETLEDDEVRSTILEDFGRRFRLSRERTEGLAELDASRLAGTMVAGILEDESDADNPEFALAPVPNLFFTRDPQIVVGDGVVISSMATAARSREPLISHYVFRHHKAFRGRDLFWMDPFDGKQTRGRRRATVEGGDVLVPRRDILLVGISERTSREGIEELARSLKLSGAGVRWLILVEIPSQRSYMHLDTVFTIINRDECLVYPPVILSGGSEEANVYQVDLSKRELTFTVQKSLLHALGKRGMDLRPIPCGGKRAIDQQREQWTDGANAFALAPGTILLYERNLKTAEELDRNGYHIVYEDDLLLGRTELETWTDRKYAIQIQGHELSRARGGPRCMTMPLEREDL
ncbi:MAG: arginine deiminase family protein [Thermoanaerobaculia bacterium]